MIELMIYGENFEQEIRTLVQSFFTGEKVQITRNFTAEQIDIDSEAAEKIWKERLTLLKEEILLQNCPGRRGKKIPEYSLDDLEKITCLLLYIGKKEIYLSMWKKETQQKEKKQIYDKEVTDRKEKKSRLLEILYPFLTAITKRQLPWGGLTGIRPTKLVLERLERGDSPAAIQHYFQSQFYCSEEKIKLSLAVASREHEILQQIDYQNGYSIYIGIPFCPSTCHYCSFPSFALDMHSDLVEPYLNALKKEIAFTASCYPGKKLETIYIGGGTPTTLSAGQLEDLLIEIQSKFDTKWLKELTVEAGRPDSITKEKLIVLKEQKVDRISINPQSMRQKTLDLIGRKHTAEQIEEAFIMAREQGHQNINMDLIIGLSGETTEDVAYTLERIEKLDPDGLTIHALAVKRAARLNIEKEKYAGLEAQNVLGMQALTNDFACSHNYLPYYLYRQKNIAENLENIGYARYGKEGIYNILIMEEKQTILALGSGGTSKFVFPEENRIERVENVKSIKDYIERIDEMIQRKQTLINR